MKKVKAFLKRKDIEFSRKRYLGDALSAMTLGLFSSLIIGLIFQTIGEQTAILVGANKVSVFLEELGKTASSLMGPAIGVAVAWGLKSPPMVLFASAVSGALGAVLGGPAGAFVAAALGAEFGKMVSKETKVDIIVTPATTLLVGALTAKTIGPLVQSFMVNFGKLVVKTTEWQPFLMGIIVAVVMGLVLTAPISSAALAVMMELSGLAAGAATAGCSAQMIGFAVISMQVNGVGGLVAQGVGTSMLQVPNIVKKPWILLPPTLASAITGPIATVLFKMTNNKEGAGMGTSGFVGQIGTITTMGWSVEVFVKILVLHIILPAIIAYIIHLVMVKKGIYKPEDLKLDLA